LDDSSCERSRRRYPAWFSSLFSAHHLAFSSFCLFKGYARARDPPLPYLPRRGEIAHVLVVRERLRESEGGLCMANGGSYQRDDGEIFRLLPLRNIFLLPTGPIALPPLVPLASASGPFVRHLRWPEGPRVVRRLTRRVPPFRTPLSACAAGATGQPAPKPWR